ncbi:MAG: cell envelope integrity EipB family protein [Gemmatimonadaceae bacterium]|nr:cell envelope integrity EipB family protein [Acetobacteraceae bacterium]
MRRHILATILAMGASLPALAADPVPLAPHRALYQLTMDTARGREIQGATGSMAYEITDACDGWATRQRLSLDITNRDGQDIELVSDYATWESKDGLSMRFRMRQTTETAVTEQVEGTASITAAGGPGTIRYTLPEEKTMPIPAGTTFPMAHTAAIIAAAEAGKRFIAVPLFDGTGAKGTQDSSVAITSWNAATGTAPYPALANLPSGRVRIAFFDRNPPGAESGAKDKVAGSPDYEVGMRYWANGVADELTMDFSDFVMQGKLSEFVIPEPHC